MSFLCTGVTQSSNFTDIRTEFLNSTLASYYTVNQKTQTIVSPVMYLSLNVYRGFG